MILDRLRPILRVVQRLAWVLLLLALPVTSFPYFPPAMGGEALVRPLSLYPLAILILLVVLPKLLSQPISKTMLTLAPFVLVATASSLLSLLRGIEPALGISTESRVLRGMLTLLIGCAFYLAMVMVHEPSSGIMVFGSADMIEDEARKTASALRKVRESLLDVYATNTGQNLSQLSEWMAAETWMTANDAKARGFADEILHPADPEPVRATASSAVAPPAPTHRPSPGVEADLARARVRSLQEKFSGASVGVNTGQPVRTQDNGRKVTP
jgi:hypothetical protein